jgi:ATP-dependent Clp protease ATP-binding subunit ClpB
MEQATRDSNWQRVSELQYGRCRLEAAEAGRSGVGQKKRRQQRLLRTEVGAEEIAEVVSRATGIPVSRMMQGERDKLLHIEDKLHERVVGQDEAIAPWPMPSAVRAPVWPIRTVRTARSCSSARPASARPS